MPLKLSVGLTKKLGQPDYGSLGAACHLECELDAGLLQNIDSLHQQVRRLYVACAQAVNDELARHETPNAAASRNATTGGNGSARNGTGGRREREATTSQVRAIRAIAGRQRTDLSTLLRDRFGIDRPESLSLGNASQLIDDLKDSATATGGRS